MMDVGFNVGKQLAVNAASYPGIVGYMRELIQNSLDGNARTITVELDFDRRTLVIRDDGNGVSQHQFAEKLRSVASSTKGEGKLGQFGIGFFSPLGKCESFAFISCPKHNPDEGYTQYDFDCKKIVTSSEVKIPNSRRRDLIHKSPDAQHGVWWRTSIEVSKMSKDKTVNQFALAEFIQGIAINYGEVIRKNNVAITINVTKDRATVEQTVVVPEFQGKELGRRVDNEQPDAGEIIIELYSALKEAKGRNGRVLFSKTGDSFSISTDDFLSCTSNLLDRQVAEALRSGIFEGRITAKKISLAADRRRFEKNDALTGLCLALESWYQKVGSKHMEETRDDDRDTRLQETGSMALPFAAQLLKRREYTVVAQRITEGTIGRGHKPDGTKVKLEEVNSLGAPVTPVNGSKSPEEGERIKGAPKKEHKDHIPGRSLGPRGRRRAIVRNHSTGLGFACVEFGNNLEPYAFDTKSGLIEINTRHRDFEACETAGDSEILAYHMLIAQTALDLASYEGTPAFENAERYALQHLQTEVFGLLNANPIVKQAAKELKKHRAAS